MERFDTRRLHRRRDPARVRYFGSGGALGQVAASPVGQFIANPGEAVAGIPAAVGQATGITNLAQGLQGLFGGTDEAGRLQALGQTVPTGVELLGPSSTFQGPGFLGSIIPGMQGGPASANPSAGTQMGQGVGELLALLEKMRQQSGGMAPMAPLPGGGQPGGIRILPGTTAQAPQGGLIHNLIGAFTYGILGGGIPSSQQA